MLEYSRRACRDIQVMMVLCGSASRFFTTDRAARGLFIFRNGLFAIFLKLAMLGFTEH